MPIGDHIEQLSSRLHCQFIENTGSDFLDGLGVRILCFHRSGPGSISGLGTEISHQATTRCGKKKKKGRGRRNSLLPPAALPDLSSHPR